MPSHGCEFFLHLFVALHISENFLEPEFAVCLGNLATVRTDGLSTGEHSVVPMPETSIDENAGAVFQ